MSTYTQANRLMRVSTPLGPDALLLSGFMAHEAISQLFELKLDLLAENKTTIPFEKLLGASVTVSLNLLGDSTRHFNGIVSRLTQGERDETFTLYRAEVVPQLWLWTKKVQSRVFQHLSVPDILKQVLKGLKVTYQFQVNYHPRDYCVQYRESDFAFASRLMEEEGIYYFFQHEDGKHEMIVTDAPQRHPDVPVQKDVIYESLSGGTRTEMRVASWEKSQELRSGKYTLWDHCFELPDTHLEAVRPILSSAVAGKVTHELKVGGNDKLEIYDYPGGYAQRFDGVDSGGGPRPAELPKIFEDSQRTVKIRIEQETSDSLTIQGAGNCGHFSPGHRFDLERHFDADGPYLLTAVEHVARQAGNYRSGGDVSHEYENRFTCIPTALPYRPHRTTPKPTIPGTQTATVVGPPGEVIFCDKYGRVKVQFHWDRHGKNDANSSCWIRVGQIWAGKGWGAFFWPRIGHEVIVAFEEGDPDQPVIIGSVYNAANMPPFVMPQSSLLNGLKSSTARGHAHENYNGILFVDVHGHEHLAIHSERHMVFNSELDKLSHAGRHKTERVSSASMFTVGSLPGGGGSGGSPNVKLFQQPEPTGVPGLNSTMVYGQNLQVAMPLNHQIAVGSNLQLCINPAGLAAGVPGFPASAGATGALGGGLGGNLQFTIGTSASIVLGRSFDINFGPKKVETPTGKNPPLLVFCGIVGGLAAVWPFVYGLVEDDDARAELSIAFQTAIDIALLALMEMTTAAKLLQDTSDEKGETLIFKYNLHKDPKDGTAPGFALYAGYEAAMVATAVLGIGILPEVLAAKNENWDAPSPSSSSCTPCPSSSPSSSGSPSSSSSSPKPSSPNLSNVPPKGPEAANPVGAKSPYRTE